MLKLATVVSRIAISTAEAREKGKDLVELVFDTWADWLFGGLAVGDFLPEVSCSLIDSLNQPCSLICSKEVEGDPLRRPGNIELVDVGWISQVRLGVG